MPEHNLELKARCSGLATVGLAATRLGARFIGQEDQTDTYFEVATGRCKLREIAGCGAELIWYNRPDQRGVRTSEYTRTPVTHDHPTDSAQTAGMRPRIKVRKKRDIYIWHNVRIHLDQVEGLGTFLELEAVLSPEEDAAKSQDRLDELCRVLEIAPEDCIGCSYADLLSELKMREP